MAIPRTVTEALPRQEQRLRMTYDEFLAWADEDVHAEWEEGEVIIFMPPKDRHQNVVRFLAVLLDLFVQFFRRGHIRFAPFEVKVTPDSPAREPDLLFVAQEHADRLTEDRLEGPADLIVEVISDDSVTRDRVKKFYEYQGAGVREYWIIDPRPGEEHVSFWVLDERGKYQPVPIGEGGVYRSTVLPGFWLRVDWLWEEELPAPLLAFAEMVGPSRVMEALRELTPDEPHSSTRESQEIL